MLCVTELRRWCRAHTKRGQRLYIRDHDREFSTMAFLRVLDWQHMEFYGWMSGEKSIPHRVQQTMSKFIADWEAGLLSFTPFDPKKKRELVRHEKPRHRTRFTVQVGAGHPRLSLLARPQPAPAMPTFGDLIRPNLRSGRS